MAERLEIAQTLRLWPDGQLERAAGPLVQLRAAGEQEVLVHHLVQQRVREAIAVALAAAACVLDQVGLDQALESRFEVPASAAMARRSCSSKTAPSTAASCSTRRASIGSRSMRDSSSPCKVAGTSTVSHAAVHTQRSPSRTKHAPAQQAADNLLDEQRIATGTRDDEVLQLAEGAAGHLPEQAADQRAGLVRRERGEPDDRLGCPRQQRRPGLGPVRYQHHQAPVCQVVGEVAQEVHRCRIGPMQVLDHKQHRQLLQAPLQQRARGERDLPLELLGLEVVRTRLRSTPNM